MKTKYQEAIENSNIVSKTDIDGIITFVNSEFCEIFEYTKEELLGFNHNIIRHPDVPKESFKTLWDTILDKKSYKATVKNLSKSGKTVYLNTTITPILDENDKIVEFIAVRYDVTKEVELKKVLEEKQKMLIWQSRMASLGQMLTNIAHQWRQPLTELNLALFNIKESINKCDKEKANEYYKQSKNVIKSMSQTIDDFSNFFDPNKDLELFLVKEAIEDSTILVKKTLEKEGIKLIVNGLNSKALGIKNELTQIFINLIQNSKDAFKEADFEEKYIKIEITENEEFVKIYFSDNAGGIKTDLIDKIFEPYFTTKHKSQGTGLGLFMSKMILEKSFNGSIEVTNIENGSRFLIKFSKVK